jgi:hypothetical protein
MEVQVQDQDDQSRLMAFTPTPNTITSLRLTAATSPYLPINPAPSLSHIPFTSLSRHRLFSHAFLPPLHLYKLKTTENPTELLRKLTQSRS